MAETRAAAHKAFEQFITTCRAKYPKAVDCLVKDRVALLAFYDFPAEHWGHLRTTNPIESTFTRIRHRTDRAKGCVTRDTILSFIYKLGMRADFAAYVFSGPPTGVSLACRYACPKATRSKRL